MVKCLTSDILFILFVLFDFNTTSLIPSYAQERSTLYIVHRNLNELSGTELEHFFIKLYFLV